MASSPRDTNRSGEILAGALRCFIRAGVEATSIHDICEESRASVGSIYHHFGNKQGIANALIVAGLRDNLEALRGPFAEADTARAGIETLVTELLTWISANEDWARFIYLRTAIPTQDVAPVLQALSAEWSALVGTAWERWVANGDVEPIPPSLVAPLLLGPAHDLARRWLSGAVDGTLLELAPSLAAAAWRCVGRNPPR